MSKSRYFMGIDVSPLPDQSAFVLIPVDPWPKPVKVGEIFGVGIYSDPTVPKGQIQFTECEVPE